jgi:hypothetical protein
MNDLDEFVFNIVKELGSRYSLHPYSTTLKTHYLIRHKDRDLLILYYLDELLWLRGPVNGWYETSIVIDLADPSIDVMLEVREFVKRIRPWPNPAWCKRDLPIRFLDLSF